LRGLRAVDLNHPASWQTADAEGEIESQRTGGDGRDRHDLPLPHPHDRTLAELLLNLAESHLECLVSLHLNLLVMVWTDRV
jgi:hypothetical protein